MIIINCENFFQFSKLTQLFHYHCSKEDRQGYHLHSVCMLYYFLYVIKSTLIFKEVLDFFGQKTIFSKFKIFTLKIIPVIPLPRFERGYSRLRITYSLYGVLFLISSKMASDLLEYFPANFQNQYSQYRTILYVTMLLIILSAL